jgi:hypothetical protein
MPVTRPTARWSASPWIPRAFPRYGDRSVPATGQDAKRRHQFADAGTLHDRLDFLGAEISAALNVGSLASGDEELVVDLVAQVTRIHPAAVHRCACDLSVAKIAVCDRRAPKVNPPLHTVAERAIRVIHDPHVEIAQGAAAGDKTKRP